MPQRSGFTLIELLITISIIAVLSVIGLVAYTSFLKNSRDSKRQADVKFIQSALEEYHADLLYYPLLDSAVGITCTNGRFKIGCPLKNPAGSRIYLNKVPQDPLSAPQPQYNYRPLPPPLSPAACDNGTTKCTSYCLFAQMEAAALTSDSVCNTLPAGFSAPRAYGVTRP